MDLLLENGRHALQAASDALIEMAGLDAAEASPVAQSRRAVATAAAFVQRRTTAQIHSVRVRVSFVTEVLAHSRIRAQRRMIRTMGLPAGRDVEALNNQLKRLETQVRTMRRQLDRAESQ